MSDPTWSFRIEGVWILGMDEIWPDGDGPKNPTVADVLEVVDLYMPLGALMSEWNLDPALTVNGELAGGQPRRPASSASE